MSKLSKVTANRLYYIDETAYKLALGCDLLYVTSIISLKSRERTQKLYWLNILKYININNKYITFFLLFGLFKGQFWPSYRSPFKLDSPGNFTRALQIDAGPGPSKRQRALDSQFLPLEKNLIIFANKIFYELALYLRLT